MLHQRVFYFSMHQKNINQLIAKGRKKDEVLADLDFPHDQDLLFSHALSGETTAWRALWYWYHLLDANHAQLPKIYHQKLLDALTQSNSDGHQRELIKLLSRASLSEDAEGQFFDCCLAFWENPKHDPSLRFVALKSLEPILKKYPETIEELEGFMESRYLESLSPGIRNALVKWWKSLKKH